MCIRVPLLFALLLLVLLPQREAAGQRGPAPADPVAEAVRLRENREYAAAARLLAGQVASHPEDAGAWMLLAQTYYWMGETTAAKACYEQALARHPNHLPLRLEYGRMLAELNEASRARRVLVPLRGEPGATAEVEALLGQLAYWAGDLTRAAAHFRAALRLQPHHPTASRLLDEIRVSSAPSLYIRFGYQRDSQPLERLYLETGGAWYLTPLHTLSLHARPQRVQLAGGGVGLATLEGAFGGYWPRLRLETRVSGGIIERTFTQDPDWTGRVALHLRLPAHLEVSGTAERAPYTTTAGSLSIPVITESLQAAVAWRRPDGWLGEASLQLQHYPDANLIATASAWTLAPVVREAGVELLAGYGFGYQDARESRFSTATGSAGPPQDGRRPEGFYTPYYTPQQVQTHSLAGALSLRPSPALALELNGSYGFYATEVVPSSPSPGRKASLPFLPRHELATRRFHPFSARAALTLAATPALSVRLHAESMRSAAWSGTQVEAGLHYRFLGGRPSGSPSR